jgi:hypothetical protein
MESISKLGPMLRFLKYFRRKNAKKLAFFNYDKAKLCENFIIKLVSEKSATFFRRKL